MPRPLTKIYRRSDRLRLDVWISSKEVIEKAKANVSQARWRGFAEYIRSVVWLASEGVILVKAPHPEPTPRPPKKKAKKKRRRKKAAPVTVSVMELD